MSQVQDQLTDEEKVRPVAHPAFLGGPQRFDGVFMRPNLRNGGMVPASGPFCTSPDIYSSGNKPLDDFQKKLITDESYKSMPADNIVLEQDNYIYVRAFNGSKVPQTSTITLYFANSNFIQKPDTWRGNIIPTDAADGKGVITNQAPDTVAVVPNVYLWESKRVQRPPSGHHCLIAQINDAANSNPFPVVQDQMDLSGMMIHNLKWTLHNMNDMSAGDGFSFSHQTSLELPVNGEWQAGYYSLVLTPSGFVDSNTRSGHCWSVGLTCSKADSKGKSIQMSKTEILQENIGIQLKNIYLEPGYSAIITVALYNPHGLPKPPKNEVGVELNYLTSSKAQYHKALQSGIVNWTQTRTIEQELTAVEGIPIKAYVILGTVTGVIR